MKFKTREWEANKDFGKFYFKEFLSVDDKTIKDIFLKIYSNHNYNYYNLIIEYNSSEILIWKGIHPGASWMIYTLKEDKSKNYLKLIELIENYRFYYWFKNWRE